MTAASQRVKHHAEDEDLAYRLQILGAREGAIKGTLVAGTVIALCNWRFPWMQRQTLAGKAFLTMWGTIFGMVTHADHYLLKWESEHRKQAEEWRTRARIELASQGSVPSETAMRAWKARDDERKALAKNPTAVGAEMATNGESTVAGAPSTSSILGSTEPASKIYEQIKKTGKVAEE